MCPLFFSYKVGSINAPETKDAEYDQVHMLYDHVPDELDAPTAALRTKWVFLTSIASNYEDAMEAYKLGKSYRLYTTARSSMVVKLVIQM